MLLDDGTVLRTKRFQVIPEGRRLVLHLPGGAAWATRASAILRW
jgi:hypothetical protein